MRSWEVVAAGMDDLTCTATGTASAREGLCCRAIGVACCAGAVRRLTCMTGSKEPICFAVCRARGSAGVGRTIAHCPRDQLCYASVCCLGACMAESAQLQTLLLRKSCLQAQLAAPELACTAQGTAQVLSHSLELLGDGHCMPPTACHGSWVAALMLLAEFML